jgi:hypothetical protein
MIKPKLTIVAVVTFAGSWVLSEIVRRLNILRPLFGLKATAKHMTPITCRGN